MTLDRWAEGPFQGILRARLKSLNFILGSRKLLTKVSGMVVGGAVQEAADAGTQKGEMGVGGPGGLRP